MLNVHPSRSLDLLEPDEVRTEPELLVSNYFDSFGNRCTRFVAPAGKLRLSDSTLVLDPGRPDPVKLSARECPVGDLPDEVLSYLLNSRYCEVDRFSNIAFELFGNTAPGWHRVQAICNWVHSKVRFDYAVTLVPPRQRWMCSPSASASAATFSTWPSRSAARSTFPRAMQPAISATSAFPRAARWTSAPGSRSSSTTAGGPSMRATIAAHRPRSHGDGPRCLRCCHHHIVWAGRPVPLLRCRRRRKGQPRNGATASANARTGGRVPVRFTSRSLLESSPPGA